MEIITTTNEDRFTSGNTMIYASYAAVKEGTHYYVASKQTIYELDGYNSGDIIEQDDSYSFRKSDELMLVKREDGIVEVLPKYLLGTLSGKPIVTPLRDAALAAAYVLAEYSPEYDDEYRRLKEEYKREYYNRLNKTIK